MVSTHASYLVLNLKEYRRCRFESNLFEFLLSLQCVPVSIYYLCSINLKALKIIILFSKQITFGGFLPQEEKGLSVAHLSVYECITRFKIPVFTEQNSLGLRSSPYSYASGAVLQKLPILSLKLRSDKFCVPNGN